ncbi:unnamed protein product [Brassica oleracea]
MEVLKVAVEFSLLDGFWGIIGSFMTNHPLMMVLYCTGEQPSKIQKFKASCACFSRSKDVDFEKEDEDIRSMESPLLTKSEHIVDTTIIIGNSSTVDDQTSHEVVELSDPYEAERFWNPIEFVVTIVQIAAALVLLIQPKDQEHPQTILFIWIIGYTCGCIATLPILCWRFWYYKRSVSSESAEEYSGGTRINEVMDTTKMVLEYFFVSWFVVFVWNYIVNPSSLDDTTTQFFWLITALLTFSFIRYVLVNLACAVVCYLLPGTLCVLAAREVLEIIMRLIGAFLATNSAVGFSPLLLEFFSSCWFMMITWAFLHESSLDHSIPLFWLCWAFLAFSCIRLVQRCVSACPFEVSKEHQEQAKAILEDESSELLKQGSVGSEDTDVGVSFANKRERRPAYERKRGHFTFKPTTTSESPQKEPTFDPSKYPKPGEYFAAYDRFLLAQREWQKQTGTFVNETHQYQPRPRRPELPGRKRGTYKHTYTASCPIGLKTSEKENPIPSEQVLEENTAAHVKTADREVDGESNDSTAYTDKNLENILTELLACSPDELDGDAGVKLLQERLNIKPVNEEMLSFPDFPDVRRMDLKASGRNPSKPRTALSNIQNLLKGINSDGSRKKSQASPSYSPEDQFSFPDRLNLLPGDQQPGEVDITKDLNACLGSSVASDADKIIPNASPSNVGTHVASEFNISVQKSSYEGVPDTNSSPYRNADNCEVDDSITNINPATLEANVDMQTKENEGDVPMGESEANINTRRRESYVDNLAEDAPGEDARMDPFTVEDETIPYQQEESSKSLNATREQYNAMDGFIEHEEHTQGQHGEENDNTDTARRVQVENAQQEAPSSSPKQTNKRSKRGASDSNMKKRSKTVHDETEKDKQTKTLSRESGAKKQTKGKANERKEKTQKKTVTRESKMFSRRKSLAAAGTNWEAGVRRSTRIKSRPLEYWRGERFLYGRVHKSLTTVIGIKYESPGKNGKGETRALKVKSFVSDDYKELVESAALH